MNEAEDVRRLLDALEGEHRRSLGDRLGNWWGGVFLSATALLPIALCEAAMQGRRALAWSPLLSVAAVVCGVVAVLYIEAFNRGDLPRSGAERSSSSAPWPVRSWRVTRGEIATVRIERQHAWRLRVSMEDGSSKVVALTDSMAKALGFEGRR